MTTVKRRTIAWILTGGTFLMVAATAGCAKIRAMVSGRGRETAPVVTAPSAAAPPQDQASVTAPLASREELFTHDAFQSPPPAPVNVFGEFDGVEREPGKVLGQSGFQQHTFVDEGFDADVAVDPSGKWLAFASTRHSEHTDIYLQRVDGLSVTQLTSDIAEDAFPTFGPDGRQIAFSSTRSGNWDIYVMDTDGRNVVQVTSGPMQDMHPSFSPDGTRLVYASLGGRSEQWELWTLNLLTNERKMIGFGLFPVWSPGTEMDRIAFQRARQRGSRWFSLWTLDLVDGEARRVTEVAVSANAAIVNPSWSPDGKQLSFATIVEPAKTVLGKPRGQQDVWTINADGSNRHRLTDGNGTNLSPCWAVDNRVYFISDRGGNEAVWSVRLDGPADFTAGGDGAGNAESAVGSTDAGEVSH